MIYASANNATVSKQNKIAKELFYYLVNHFSYNKNILKQNIWILQPWVYWSPLWESVHGGYIFSIFSGFMDSLLRERPRRNGPYRFVFNDLTVAIPPRVAEGPPRVAEI